MFSRVIRGYVESEAVRVIIKKEVEKKTPNKTLLVKIEINVKIDFECEGNILWPWT